MTSEREIKVSTPIRYRTPLPLRATRFTTPTSDSTFANLAAGYRWRALRTASGVPPTNTTGIDLVDLVEASASTIRIPCDGNRASETTTAAGGDCRTLR